MSVAGFRLNAVNLFLTYPQCPIPKDTMLELLQSKLNIKGYIIGQEQHQDGQLHLHCYLNLHSKYDARNPNCLDVVHNGVVYHGNYQSARNVTAVMEYCRKDGNFIEAGVAQTRLTWGECLDSAKDADDFLALMRTHYPREYILNHDKMKAFAAVHYKRDLPVYTPRYTEFVHVVPEMTEWVNTHLRGMHISRVHS